MKIEQLIQEKEKVEIVTQAEAIRQNKFMGRIKLERGQSLFELDPETRMIYQPKTEAVYDIKGNVRNKYITKPGCLYTTAINLKNAERKFIKMLEK